MQRTTAALVGAIAPATMLALAPGITRTGLDRFTAPKEMVIVSLVAAAGALAAAVTRVVSVRAIDLVLIAVFALGVLGACTVATDPDVAWRAVAMSGAAIAAFWLARGAPPEVVLASVAVACTLGAISVLGEAFGLWSLSLTGRAPGGLDGHRNFMAHGLALGLPAAVVIAMRQRRWFGMAAVAAVIAAITLSRCRTAWVATALGLAVLGFATWRAGRARGRTIDRRRALSVVVALLAGASLAVAVPNRLAWGSPSPYADTVTTLAAFDHGSGRGRVLQYAATARLFAEHPLLGVGPGQWSIAYPEVSVQPDANYTPLGLEPVSKLPNADWLPFAAERGLPALVLLLLAGALAIRACMRAARSSDAPWAAVAALATIAVAAIEGSFDAVLMRPTPLVMFALVVGAGMGSAGGGRTLSRRLRVAAVAIIVALGALALCRPGRAIAAMYRYESTAVEERAAAAGAYPSAYEMNMTVALELTKRGDCELARAHARAVLEHYPHHILAQRLVDRCDAIVRGPRDHT